MAHAEDEIRAKATILLADLASIGPIETENSSSPSSSSSSGSGAIDAIYRNIPPLLASQKEHVLVHATNFIRVLAIRKRENQNRIARLDGVLDRIVAFLSFEDSPMLRSTAAGALAALAADHADNQKAIVVEAGAVSPLVLMLRLSGGAGDKSKTMAMQMQAASAIRNVAKGNPECQKIVIEKEAPKHLIRLMKVRMRI